MTEKYLVTGGAGFIGSNICRRLVAEGCYVRVIDNLLTGKKSNLADIWDKIEFIEADMGDAQVACAAMKDIDVVLHQGAVPSVPRSVDDPVTTHQHCVNATFTLLLAARDNKIKRFVYAASSSLTATALLCLGRNHADKSQITMPPPNCSYYCSVFPSVRVDTISPHFNVFGPYQTHQPYAAAFGLCDFNLAGSAADGLRRRRIKSRFYIDNIVQANLLAVRAQNCGQVVNIACGQKLPSMRSSDDCSIVANLLSLLRPTACRR